MDLDKDVKYVKGVGPNRVKLLNKLGIYTLKDLITYYPRDYEDRSKPKLISDCNDGEEVTIEGIACGRVSEIRMAKRTMQKLLVRDETGGILITWFNQSYLKNKFEVGKKYRFYGKVSFKYGKAEMASPVFDNIEQRNNTGRIVPIYPLTYQLSQNVLRKIMENAILEVRGNLYENLPEEILTEYHLEEVNKATEEIHFPKQLSDFERARRRFVFEELLSVQLALLALKNYYKNDIEGIEFSKEVHISDVIQEFPFKLTGAQRRVLEEIEGDMERKTPMNRLLQGDFMITLKH